MQLCQFTIGSFNGFQQSCIDIFDMEESQPIQDFILDDVFFRLWLGKSKMATIWVSSSP